MATLNRCALAAVVGVLAAGAGPVAPAEAAVRSVAKIQAAPGELVRWTVPGTKRCTMGKRSWLALQETCYYPIDLLEKPGVVTIGRRGAGPAEFAQLTVVATDYGVEEIQLPDIPQANPSPADLERNAREQERLDKIWKRPEGPARFTLPLGKPATPLPEGTAFGAKRVFNGKPADQPHTGADYPISEGTPIVAAADGTVVLVDDLFYAGKSVLIDHGNGLVTIYFHLADFSVQDGQEVKKGEQLGRVGSTGRATGPHLFFGVRWHNARINPNFLLEDPAKVPAVAP